MKIAFYNLGPYDEMEMEIPDKGLLGMIGASGSGKSSFMLNMTWVLTGEPRNGIDNKNAKKNAKVWGSLEWGDFRIYRQKHPGKLEVTDGDFTTDEFDTASKYLASKFGTPDLILATSYLAQKSTHAFISAPSSEKLELLQSLVWTYERPEVTIAIVDNRIKEVTDLVDPILTKIDKLEKEIGDVDKYDFSKYVEDVQPLEAELEETTRSLKDLDGQIAELNQIRGKLELLRGKLEKLPVIKEAPDSLQISDHQEKKKKLETEMKTASEYVSYLTMKKKVDNLKKQIGEIDSLINKHEIKADLDAIGGLKKIVSLENKYKEGTELVKKLNIPYDQEKIKEVIAEMKIDSEYYKHSTNRVKLAKLQSNLGNPPEYTLEQLEKWKVECSLLTCPSCQAGLRYQNEKLVLESSTVSEIPIGKEKIDSLIKKWKEYLKNKDLIENLEASIPELPQPKWKEKDLKYLSDLMKIEVVSLPPLSSEDANLLIKRKTLLEQVSSYKLSEMAPQRSTEEILSEMKKIDLKIKETEENNRTIQNRKKLSDEIEILEKEEEKLNGIEEQVEKLTKRSKKLTKIISTSYSLRNVKAKMEKLERKKEKQKGYTDELNLLLSIKPKMIKVQYDLLEDSVVTLNAALNNILETMFEEPCQVMINCSKEIKSTKQIKSIVNLKYYIRGMNSDSYKILSGGQLDRVSMALTLALSQMSSVPFILFDESIASLNADLRDAARTAIRSHCGDKLVIISNHNDTEADYDDIIDLENVI